MGFGASMNMRSDAKLQHNMRKLSATMKDLRPVMKRVGVYMVASTNKNFRRQGMTSKWPDLAESTKRQRAKKGKWPGRMLDVHGASGLRGSITFQAGREDVVIGTSVPYARKHQFGIGVPKRPFLGFLPQDKVAISRIVADGIWRKVKRI
jgi:phage virion morphogenesis protein